MIKSIQSQNVQLQSLQNVLFDDSTFLSSYSTDISFTGIANFSNLKGNIDSVENRFLNIYREQQGFQNVSNGIYEIHPCCYSNACMHTEAIPEMYLNPSTSYTVEFSAYSNAYNNYVSGNTIFNCVFEETTTSPYATSPGFGFIGDYRRNPDTDSTAPATGTGYTLEIVIDNIAVKRFPGLDISQWHIYKMQITGYTINFYIDNSLVYTGSLSANAGRIFRFKIAEGGYNHITYVDYIRITTNSSLDVNKWRFAANTRFSNNNDTYTAGKLFVDTNRKLDVGAYCSSNIESTMNIRPNITFGRGTTVSIDTQILTADGSGKSPGEAGIGFYITDTLDKIGNVNNGIFTLFRNGGIKRHQYKINGVLTDAAPSSVGLGTYNIKMSIDANGGGKVQVNNVTEMSFTTPLPNTTYYFLMYHLAQSTPAITTSEQKISRLTISSGTAPPSQYYSCINNGCQPSTTCPTGNCFTTSNCNNACPGASTFACTPACNAGEMCILGTCVQKKYITYGAIGLGVLGTIKLLK